MARPRIRITDWIMLGLALGSIALLVWEMTSDLSPDQQQAVFRIDLAIIAVFAVEFSIRWAKSDNPKQFPFRNWYEILGMIPVSHPAIRSFRLLRFIRIIVILSRFGRAADRAFGEEFTYRVVRRFKRTIADAISGIVTLRVLDETAAVMGKGRYCSNLADALDEYGDDMVHIAVEKVKEDPDLGRIRHLPFFDDVVEGTSRIGQRVVIDMLRDERMDALVTKIIMQNVQQIQDAVRSKESQLDASEHADHEALTN